MKLLLAAMAILTSLLIAQGQYNSNKPPPFFKGEKRKDDGTVRTLQGTVKLPDDSPIEAAVVKLKNVKTLQVRSFITKPDGSYLFGGLSTNADYEIWADHDGKSSETRTLSVFDSRKIAIINLKVEPKKSEK
ncbi:MAG: carboxypeptidase-like regulatory domain-containing protein [Bryobacteraceae bacterium]|nr:carboxypeptidase-like regulatory domain-containing protein [Bryobacteraceae bacterium]